MPSLVGAHGFDRVEQIDGAYVLQCGCGWRSPRDESAAVVGTAWDHHLAEVGAGTS